MKKLIAGIGVTTLLALTLVGCGSNSDNSDMISDEYKVWKEYQEKRNQQKAMLRDIVEEILWEMGLWPPYYYDYGYSYGYPEPAPYWEDSDDWGAEIEPWPLQDQVDELLRELFPDDMMMPVEPDGGIGGSEGWNPLPREWLRQQTS